MIKFIKYIIIFILAVIILVFIIPTDETPVVTTTTPETPAATPAATQNEYTFTDGNYVSGIHFNPGVYDIIATGIGNVSSDNMFEGGVNMIAPHEAKNIKLPEKSTLTVQSIGTQIIVKIKKTN